VQQNVTDGRRLLTNGVAPDLLSNRPAHILRAPTGSAESGKRSVFRFLVWFVIHMAPLASSSTGLSGSRGRSHLPMSRPPCPTRPARGGELLYFKPKICSTKWKDAVSWCLGHSYYPGIFRGMWHR
jgi:hypothetical protein